MLHNFVITVESNAEVHVSLGEVGLQAKGLPELYDSLVAIALFLQRVALKM
jgi:type III secretion system FlhB-like substrate exporter